jgi:hypothetical protein
MPVESEYVAVISRLDIQSDEFSESTMKSINNAVLAAMYNTGNFEEVYFGKLPEDLSKIPTYIEIVLNTTHVDSINWWVLWPAVFPMPLYWPIQMINGQVNVSLSTKLFIDGKNSISIDLTSLHDYS